VNPLAPILALNTEIQALADLFAALRPTARDLLRADLRELLSRYSHGKGT
jgi:hypothetical protein